MNESIGMHPETVLRQLLAANGLADALGGLELLALGGDPGIRLRYRPDGEWSVRIELPLDQLTLILTGLEDWRRVAPSDDELLAEAYQVFGSDEKRSE